MSLRSTWAIIPAAGKGTRYSSHQDKLLCLLNGIPVLQRTIESILGHPELSGCIVVVHRDNEEAYTSVLDKIQSSKTLKIIPGGTSRRESVFCGLQAIHEGNNAFQCRNVLIHDAARPLINQQIISDGLSLLKAGEKAVLTALPITDTVKQSFDGKHVDTTLNREHLWRAQTPQFFDFDTILKAHQEVPQDEIVTDDIQLVEMSGLCPIRLIKGSERNLKITHPEDLALATFWLTNQIT